MITCSVVIPVYNGSRTIGELVAGLNTTLGSLNLAYEIILIDDLSKDNSWERMIELARKDTRIKAVKLAGNFGQHNATMCGLTLSRGRYVVTMDDDLQHLPRDIATLLNRLQDSGAKVVIARLTEKNHSLYRRLASHLVRRLAEILIGKPIGLHLSSFRIIERSIVDKMISVKLSRPYVPALIFRFTKAVVNAEVRHGERKYGSSNYTVSRMFKLTGQLISNCPLAAPFLNNSSPAFVIEKVVDSEAI